MMTAAPASTPLPEGRPLERSAEQALREGLLEGNARAWRDFETLYGRLVSCTITRVVGKFGIRPGSEDIREIRASFCLELLANDKAKLRAFAEDRGARFSTWIAMLAAHTAYDFLRRRRREPAIEIDSDADALCSETPDPYVLCELGERARLVGSLVKDFSEKDREFLELYFAEGLPPDAIAERMGISVKTVYSKKHKIQGRLEALLERRRLAA